jgi:uncharacterized membrane protein YeiH
MAPSAPADLAVWLEYLDLVGIAVFALSGAVLAATKRLTLVTFIFLAVVTATGGGTTRDLLIGAPVFWISANAPLLVCLGAALIVWLTPARIWDGAALLWLDAAGLAAYATYGAAKALAYGVAPLPAAALGILSACLGGIIRDVLAGEDSILMRPELYVTAAALSAVLMVGLLALGLPAPIAGLLAALVGFGLRGLAIWKGLSLPAYGR